MSSLKLFSAVVASRWPVVVVAVGACAAVGMGYWALAPERYTASSTLMLDPVAVGGASNDASLRTELDLLRSEHVAQRVVANLHLADGPTARKSFLESGDTRRTLSEYLSQEVLDHARATAIGEGGIVRVSFTAQDADFAAQVANAYPQAYGEVSLEVRAASIRSGVERAGKDLALLRAHVEQARIRRASLGENGLDSIAVRAGEQFARLAQIALKAAGSSPSIQPTAQPSSVGPTEEAGEMQGLGQLQPMGSIAREPGAPGRVTGDASPEQDLRLAQQNLDRAEERLARLSAESIGAPFPAHLLVAATAPRTSSKPSAQVCAAIGVAAGLLIGLLAVLAIEALDRRVRRTEDITRKLGIVVLGDLPAMRIPMMSAPRLDPAPRWLGLRQQRA